MNQQEQFEGYESVSRIVDSLQDEESKILFYARIEYLKNRDPLPFYKTIDDLKRGAWRCSVVDEAWAKRPYAGIVIFGCGRGGRRTKTMLKVAGYEPDCFCDSDPEKVGTIIRGIPVCSVDDVVSNLKNHLIVLGSMLHAEEMYKILLGKGVPKENILYDENKGFTWVQTQCGQQYFDVFPPQENEVFIDAGAYDGGTTLQFASWSNGAYRKIFSIEPTPTKFQVLKKRCNGLKDVELLQNAVWDKEEKLSFFQDPTNMAGSRIGEGVLSVVGRPN